MPIPVLFVIPALEHGGPDRVFSEVLRHLPRDRFTSSLAVYERTGGYLDELPDDVDVTVLDRPTRLWSRYPADALVQHVWHTRPRLVVATLSSAWMAGTVRPAFPPGTRLVARVANDVSSIGKQLAEGKKRHRIAARVTRRAYRTADRLIAQSAHMARELDEIMGIDPSQIYTLHNPIDVDRAQALAAEDAPTLAGSPALVSVGRLFAQKGLDYLIEALTMVTAELPDLHVTLVGDGPDKEALEAQAEALGVRHHLTFLGFHSKPLPLVRAADAFVLPSRYEGFSNAVLEALAIGTPVVVTDCPGANRDMVRPGIDGWLVRTEDPAAIAQGLRDAAAGAAELDRHAIRAGCAERFAAQGIVAQWAEALLDAAG